MDSLLEAKLESMMHPLVGKPLIDDPLPYILHRSLLIFGHFARFLSSIVDIHDVVRLLTYVVEIETFSKRFLLLFAYSSYCLSTFKFDLYPQYPNPLTSNGHLTIFE